MRGMRVSAKVDYAVRAAAELASGGEGPIKGETLSKAQGIPLKFLENILGELKHAGIVRSQRGTEGGYWLARPADEIKIADVIRAVEGPLASVRGEPPETVKYMGAAEPLGKAVGRGAREPTRGAGGDHDRRHRQRRAPQRDRGDHERPAGVGHSLSH